MSDTLLCFDTYKLPLMDDTLPHNPNCTQKTLPSKKCNLKSFTSTALDKLQFFLASTKYGV